MIQAVVIDDSAFMRKALQIMLESDDEIEVIGTARDGEEGFNKVKTLHPDIVTLDIEMPRTNGFECLDMIMKEVPTPVLIVSSLTTEGAQTTLEAMDRGAMDFIPKTQSFVAIDITEIQDDLIAKVKTIAKRSFLAKARRRSTHLKRKTSTKPASQNTYNLGFSRVNCVTIGVSTGGPPVVTSILESLPENFPAPILVAQHMPKEFTGAFASRLNSISKLNVTEAQAGDTLSKGNVYIGKGGKHLVILRKGVQVLVDITIHPRDHLYHPSADILISSATKVYGSSNLGVILTGMGKDGVEGLKELKHMGGKVIAQNEESCVVYGMPKAAVDAGITDAVLPVDGIISALKTVVA